MSSELLLSDLVRLLSESLLDLQRERKATGAAPLWKITDCEIELNVVTREARNIDGKISAAIFATSATSAYASEQVHKVKLRLAPLIPSTGEESDEDTLDVPVFLRRQLD